MKGLTPEQYIKVAIMDRVAAWENLTLPAITPENFDAVYDEFMEKHEDHMQDARSEIRGGTVETGLDAPFSRHYEATEVAMQMPDGVWVGWTYWHGGGKWGEPGAIDWMDSAYFLDCKEEEKVVVVREFSKQETTA